MVLSLPVAQRRRIDQGRAGFFQGEGAGVQGRAGGQDVVDDDIADRRVDDLAGPWMKRIGDIAPAFPAPQPGLGDGLPRFIEQFHHPAAGDMRGEEARDPLRLIIAALGATGRVQGHGDKHRARDVASEDVIIEGRVGEVIGQEGATLVFDAVDDATGWSAGPEGADRPGERRAEIEAVGTGPVTLEDALEGVAAGQAPRIRDPREPVGAGGGEVGPGVRLHGLHRHRAVPGEDQVEQSAVENIKPPSHRSAADCVCPRPRSIQGFPQTMAFDFDRCPERAGTDSTKWHRYADKDIIPCWIADMDFMAPPAVVEAVRSRAAHGVYGYPAQRDAVFAAVVQHVRRRHGWEIKPEWITFMCSLVPGIHAAIRCASRPGESVVTTVPVYPPFMTAPILSERNPLKLEMVFVQGRWTFDWAKLEAACAQPHAKVLLLCNPYNPLARVFDRGELDRLAALVRQHGLTVCSDEIHGDLVLDPAAQHIVFATLGEDIAARTVTLMAASKTFNIAGLTCGFAIIPDAGLRTRFRRVIQGLSLDQNMFGLAATQAAFDHGEPWRLECVDYLRGNLDLVEAELKSMPGVVLRQRPQASFLAWFDITALGFDDAHAEFEQGGVGLSNGADFGGPGHVRLNFGCPRERLQEILRRMRKVVERAPGRRT